MARPHATGFAADLSTRSLEVFLAVCDSNTMSGAALSLGVSQAAVSQQIARIERMLGLQLLHRGSGGLVPTPAGLQFRYHALRILETAREAERAMARHQGVLIPRIVCGLMETMSEALGPTFIETLKPLAENVEIHSQVSYRLEDAVGERLYDIAVVASDAMVKGPRWFELVTEPGVLVVPKGFFLGPVDIAALAERLPMVRFNAQRKLGQLIDGYLSRVVFGVPRRYEFDRVSMIVHLVALGEAWAITTPFGLLQARDALERIDVLPLPGPGFQRTIMLGAWGDRLSNIPETLVRQSRQALARVRDGRIARIAPRTVAEIRIPEG